jgi:hypothetical protein
MIMFGVCCVLGSVEVVAQQGERPAVLRPTFARVLDAAGESLAGAVVTFVGGLPHLMRECQEIHEVQVAADHRGRAIAKLLPDLCYVAWASGPEVDGVSTWSPVKGYFGAGAMLEIVCSRVRELTTCKLVGTQAWQHLAPLSYFAVTPIPGIERELESDGDMLVKIPEAASQSQGSAFCWFEVRTADGQPLWSVPLREEVRLPPPRKVRIRAVDDSGRPLKGAKVLHRVGQLLSWRLDRLRSVGSDRMRRVGLTDDDGYCTIELPSDKALWGDADDNLMLFVEAEGRPKVAGGYWRGAFYADDHKVNQIKDNELVFTCRKAEPLQGRIAGAPQGTIAHLSAICKVHLSRTSYMHDARAFAVEVDKGGAFTFLDVPEDLHSCRVSFLPPTGSDWQPPIFAPESARELPIELKRESGAELQSLELVVADVSVTDPSGRPARGSVALVSSADRRGILMRDSLLRVALDQRGLVRLRVAPGNWVFVLITDSGYCGEVLELKTDGEKVHIVLQPLETMTVALTDRQGQPIAGARVESAGGSTRGTNDPVASILQGLTLDMESYWRFLRTDDEGKVSIPFVPIEGCTKRARLAWESRNSTPFTLEDGATERVKEEDTRKNR